MNKKKEVIVLCPSNISSYSISCINLLLNNNIHIDQVIICKLLSLSNIKLLIKLRFIKTINKIYTNLYSTLFEIKKSSGFTEFKVEAGIVQKSVTQLCLENSITFNFVPDLNSNKCTQLIKNTPTIALFTGGGIISCLLKDRAKLEIINIHMGILPLYRGRDCNLWALHKNDYKNIGLTAHIMDETIDTGDIINFMFIDYLSSNKNISDFIKYIEFNMANFAIKSTIEYINNGNKAKQNKVYKIFKEMPNKEKQMLNNMLNN